jgi:hypothetical protein
MEMEEMEEEMKHDQSCVYKSCMNDWIVTLQPVKGTITNIDRDNVVDQRYAKFRGNKFMVVGIEHKYDPSMTTKSVTSCYDVKSLVYEIGELVEVEDYNIDKNIVCTSGIHFFLTRETAFSYEKPSHEYFEQFSGHYVKYYDDGKKSVESAYENGKLHGPYVGYHANGKKYIDVTYEKGERHGSYYKYYNNGNKFIEATYVNDKLHGVYVSYHCDGSKNAESTYKNGKLHGPDIIYGRDTDTIRIYENGKQKRPI